jgi:hypothetical protein
MIPAGATANLSRLLDRIIDLGIEDIAKTSEHCWETAHRIIETGSDLPHEGPEIDHDTMLTIQAIGDPHNWGISDPAWIELCDQWRIA